MRVTRFIGSPVFVLAIGISACLACSTETDGDGDSGDVGGSIGSGGQSGSGISGGDSGSGGQSDSGTSGGGSGGMAGSAAADAGTDAGGGTVEPSLEARGRCPAGLPGPFLVEVPLPDGGSYCIDATEVTNAQYQAFLDTSPSTSGQPPECGFNTDFAPDNGFWESWPPEPGKDNYPVAYVDWCDAYAYCEWAGKRLCGKIGGGPNAFEDYGDATKSEWYNVCSMGGLQKYPYGDSFGETTCVGASYDGTEGYQSDSDVAKPVGSATGCHGTAFPFDSIFDLSGNVYEWENSCETATGKMDYCHARGGSFKAQGKSPHLCDGSGSGQRVYRIENWGFRCCAD